MLDTRKMRILEAIVSDYIASAEPIGSRTIARKYDLGVSSATIRNEMSDLEEMGYILQPHASAGRVPSDKGYRLYVNEAMPRKNLAREQREYLKRAIAINLNRVDQIMRDVARAVTYVTNYTTVAAEPVANRHKIKHIQLVPVDANTLAMMVITDLRAVKNRVVTVPCDVNYNTAVRMSQELTRLLVDSGTSDLNGLFVGVLQHRFNEMRLSVDLVPPILDAVSAALASADNVQIFTSGMKNILEFPEFADLEKARAVVGALEEKEGLLSLLADESDEIQIIIGEENTNAMLKDCSIIKAKIRINEYFSGNIAIIGPTRMDYSQVMTVLTNLVKVIL